jgi:outer membrane protein OmpA-like peptidoglycan-associated protein/tetratricopeptide (TPR) repeat protein
MKKIIIYLSILAAVQTSDAQTQQKAEKKFESIAFASSINAYQKLGEPETKTALSQMANSFRLNGDYENAEFYYTTLMKKDPDVEDILHYAQVLLSVGNCNEAIVWYQKYQAAAKDDKRSFIQNCDEINHFTNKNIEISPLLALNSENSEFSAIPFKGGIVLTSTQQTQKGVCKDNWTGEGFSDLYYADIKENEVSNMKHFGAELNVKYHDGTATFNRAGNTMYFTRTNPTGKNALNQRELKIFVSHYKNGSWSEAVEMPFNSNEYSSCHPTLSNDGKRIYFASNRPGGLGGMDIWVSNLEYGRWSEPKNLGAAVNTSGNEVFPYVNDKNTLYFSSNGHKGLGGLDIFSATMQENIFANVENMGKPLNSSFDDFSYSERFDGESGYFATNRKGGAGRDDIYFWKKSDKVTPPAVVEKEVKKEKIEKPTVYKTKINIIDATTGNPLDAPTMTIAGPNLAPTPLVQNGVEIDIIPSGQYTIKGEMNGYLPHTFTVEGIDLLKSPSFAVPLFKNMTDMERPYEMLNNRPILNGKTFKTGEVIEIQDIYYDYNQANIRIDASIGLKKLAEIMLRYPTLEVELSSHTDSRGKRDYNQKLSEKRATEAVAYLISRGIAKSRMTAKGYGEEKLSNECGDNVDCSEEQHQRNRRTEVRVTKFEGF